MRGPPPRRCDSPHSCYPRHAGELSSACWKPTGDRHRNQARDDRPLPPVCCFVSLNGLPREYSAHVTRQLSAGQWHRKLLLKPSVVPHKDKQSTRFELTQVEEAFSFRLTAFLSLTASLLTHTTSTCGASCREEQKPLGYACHGH